MKNLNSRAYSKAALSLLALLPPQMGHTMDRVQCITRTEEFNPQKRQSQPQSIVLTSAPVSQQTAWKASFDLHIDGRWKLLLDASNEKTPMALSITGAKDAEGTRAEMSLKRASQDPRNSVQYVNNRSYSLDVRFIRNNKMEFVRCYVCQDDVSDFDVERSSCTNPKSLETQAQQLGFQFRNIEIGH